MNKKLLFAAAILTFAMLLSGCSPKGKTITPLHSGTRLSAEYIWRGDYQRTGYIDVSAVKEMPRAIWQVWYGEKPQGTSLSRFVNSSPLYYENRVYFFDVKGTLHCLSADTGKEVWEKQFAVKSNDWSLKSRGENASLVMGNAIFFSIGSHIFGVDTNSGKTIYHFVFKNGIISGHFVVKEGVLYFSAERRVHFIGDAYTTGTYVCALNLKTGKVEHSDYIKGETGKELSFENGILLLTTQHKVIALNAKTCSILYEIAGKESEATVAPIQNGMFYAPFARGIRAFDIKSGKVLWSTDIIPAERHGNIGNPAVHEGTVYFVAKEYGRASTLYALDAKTGSILWKTVLGKLPSNGGTHPENLHFTLENLALVRNTAYASVYENGAYLVAIDLTSRKVLWKYPFSEALLRNLPALSNGAIYAQDAFYIEKLK